MSQPVSYMDSTHQRPDKVMEPEQFTQVVEAILEGKYSWACVLILRFAGYNPLHYIPYRTYNRLVKDNKVVKTFNKYPSKTTHQDSLGATTDDRLSVSENTQTRHSSIQDLAHLETQESASKIRGGWRFWFMG